MGGRRRIPLSRQWNMKENMLLNRAWKLSLLPGPWGPARPVTLEWGMKKVREMTTLRRTFTAFIIMYNAVRNEKWVIHNLNSQEYGNGHNL